MRSLEKTGSLVSSAVNFRRSRNGAGVVVYTIHARLAQ